MAYVAPDQPLYYRFIFRPDTGEVIFSHNHDDPARVQTHGDMSDAGHRGFPGYAYRIQGGWRLLDWMHDPLTDPYIVSTLLAALREKEAGPSPRDEQRQASFRRFRYGLPY